MADADFRPVRPIALVGMMGAGKSTIGAALAARLGLAFVDSDDEVEKASRMSVAETFDRVGEAVFRDREFEALARSLDGTVRIIATGGGAVIRQDLLRRLLDACTVVWLDAPVDILVQRVEDGRDRPLLREGDAREILTRLLTERRDSYAKAHLRISAEPPVEAVVDAVIAGLAVRA